MNRNMRGWMYVIFAVLIMCITLGYAYLNTELDINGTTNITSANWSIYWDNIQLGSNNVTDITTPTTISSGLTEVTFNVNFSQPGDTYEFTVDAVNDGSINAMVSVVSNGVFAANGTTPKTLPDYLEYSVTYSDGVAIAQNHLLEAGDTETYKVRVHYKEDISSSQLPSTADNYMFKFSVTYAQADRNAETRPVPSFADASWEVIINNVRNNPDVYELGDTKEIDMGTFGTHTLRIANITTPEECSAEGFSQTACGFVLEFADIITTHRMSLYATGFANTNGSTVNGTGNKGGWEYSDMRAFLNSTTYTHDNIDYSTTGIYNSLPEVLRNAIIDTIVVSGHGSVDTKNYTTTDKLYLLSRKEVWNTGSNDTAQGQTRQIDFYASQGVTTSSYSAAAKKYLESDSSWWLRSAYSGNANSFVFAGSGGSWNNFHTSDYVIGVSPAFRIA